MRINSIKIENLFEIFNYDISFNNSENVLIITGPNGFGKTMVLNVIFNLFNRNFSFFQKLVFDKITLELDDNISILISKSTKDEGFIVNFLFTQNNKILEKFDYSNIGKDKKTYNLLTRNQQHIEDERWLMRGQSNIFNYDFFPDEKIITTSEKINQILDSIQVHLIQEQRLLKKVQDYREDREEQTIMIESIKTYSQDLKILISDFSQKSFIQTQDLDSSYPSRLRSETNILSKEEYERRYSILKTKQKKLTEFGLYESRQEFLTFSEEDAKALSVYLKDFELKLGVFDALLEKLELFTNILNERRFTFKSINISRDKGFFFKTIKNKELDLSQLSSGEQHEVVLLYELIFNVKPNVLVLIDEPEISLHITWQKEFLSDLLKIIKIQKIQVLIATHSPSIINDRWDLVYNLETKAA